MATAPTVMIMAPIKKIFGWPNLSPIRAPKRTVLPSTSRFKITIQEAVSRSVPKLRAMLGRARVTGRLDSCTSNWPPVMEVNTWRRSGVLTTSL